MMILLLSVADAFLTITLIMGGAQEANPLLAFVLHEHPEFFAALKMGLTGSGVLVLVAVARARLFRIMRVGLVLQGVFVGYVALIAYEWWLLRALLVTQARLNLMVVWLHYARLRVWRPHNRLHLSPKPKLMSTVFKHQYATSHLQGANATYVEWLYEQFLAEPGSVPAEWRQYFGTLAADRRRGSARADRSSRNAALAAAWLAGRRRRAGGRRGSREREAGRSLAVDSGLQPPRSSNRRSRSARYVGASRTGGVELRFPRAGRGRFGARVLDRRLGRHRPLAHEAAGHSGAAEANLLRQARGRVCAHLARSRAALAARAVRGEPGSLRVRVGRADHHSRQLDACRRNRALSEHAVRRPEAFLAGRQRDTDPGARRPHPTRRRSGCTRARHRHGAPRPIERARQRARQVAARFVLRIRGRVRPRAAQGLGRRQIPQGLLGRRAHAGRQRPYRAGVQPVASRDRQPRRRRLGTRTAGSPRRHAR